jgi:hypothetical protein
MYINNINLDILRNCSHYANVQTGLLSGSSGYECVVKKAFTRKGVQEIAREKKGVEGFCLAMKVKENQHIIDYHNTKSSAVLIMKYIDGDIGDCHAGIDANNSRLMALFDFYKEHDLQGCMDGAHGDLSISNILFSDNTVRWIIDWENYNDLLPAEHDLIYCLTELMIFEFTRNKKINRKTIEQYWDFINIVEGIYKNVDEKIRKGPASWLRNNIENLIEAGDESMKKCPFVNNELDIILSLDSVLCK